MNLIDLGLMLAQAADTAADSVSSEVTTMDQLLGAGRAILVYILPIVAAIFIARFIARSLRMQETHGWKLSLVLAVLTGAIIVIVENRGVPKMGVDLRGGVHIIGALDEKEADAEGVQARDIIDTLRKRIDPSGVREIVLRARGKYQIEVIIPDVDQAEAVRIWELLAKAGKLQFRIVADGRFADHERLIRRARETTNLREKNVFSEPTSDNPQGEVLGRWHSLARIAKDSDEAKKSKGYLHFKFTPLTTHLVRNADDGTILNPPANVLLSESEVAFTRWCEAVVGSPDVDIEILMVQPPEKENVEGEHLSQIRVGFDGNANPAVHFGTTAEGSKRMGRLTNRNKPKDGEFRLLGIVLDDRLNSAPRINSVITDSGIIQGRFTEREVEDLVNVLKSGKLDVALKDNWVSFDQVESTLGAEMQRKGFLAIGSSLILVMIFVLFYYRFPGVVACFALLLNLMFILAAILLVKQALTLAGLAGLVLTIGMSIDANVLIFERIREELKRGAALRMAIRNGFDRATTTIIDANVTTLLTAIILYLIGTEQIKSFAVTLVLGILMGMFTAIFCSRIVFDIAERRRWITELKMLTLLRGTTIDFFSKQRLAILASLAIIVVGMVAVFQRGGTILDKDLRGGTTARIILNQDSSASEVASLLRQTDYRFPPRDEKVEFEVTSLVGDSRTFIINSNLPALSVEEIGASAEILTLDKILTKEFAGRLAMLGLEYSGFEVKNLANPGQSEHHPAGDVSRRIARREHNEHRAWKLESWKPALQGMLNPFYALIMAESSANMPQDENVSNEVQELDGNTDNPEVEADDNVDDPQQPSVAFKQLEVTTLLKFEWPISDDSVRGGLVQAANSLGDVRVDYDRDIRVSNPTGTPGQSREWQASIRVVKEDDARRIFEAFKQRLDGSPFIPETSAVGGQVASEARWQAAIAILASLLGIVAYLWIRFQNIAFGLAAVVALVHDVVIVLGAIAVSFWFAGIPLIDNFKISLPVIAAFLTIIGYSLNDTIVTFDRIREVRGKRTDLTPEIVNNSISQTLSRTILTSLTTFIVAFLLFAIGGDSIHAFAFSLVVGVVVGTYSSIFIAAPTLYWLMNRGKKIPSKTAVNVKEATA
ncbi:MAG TPA: protein translocase subunit SecD [Pirellulaceae bacterium]|nr:protein translocase subunit SecD [Pirellulaceae bacterium]